MVRSFFCSKCGQENQNIVVDNGIAKFVCENCGLAHEIEIDKDAALPDELEKTGCEKSN